MPDISSITLPSGTKYDIKDAQARSDISYLESVLAGGIKVVGETTTEIEDGSFVDIILVNGASHVARKGDMVWYNQAEYLYDGEQWRFIGDLSSIGALGYKDSASGTYTPDGTISRPIFEGRLSHSTTTYTPVGEISISDGSEENYTPSGVISTPTFSGSSMTATGTFTPSGNISKPSITITPSTEAVTSIDDVGTLPSFTATVANENLTLGFNAGSLPTKSAAQYVLVGASAELDNAPVFTGTEATIMTEGTPEGSVSQPEFTGSGVHLEFIGQEEELDSVGFPSGTISIPEFTGTPGTITVT